MSDGYPVLDEIVAGVNGAETREEARGYIVRLIDWLLLGEMAEVQEKASDAMNRYWRLPEDERSGQG